MDNKLKAEINKILDANYHTDKQHRVRITEADKWDNEQLLKNGYEILRDFLAEKGIAWKEFIGRMIDEYQEDFMYDNYNNEHSEALQIIKNNLTTEAYEKNEQDISDYIADKLVVGLSYKEWDEILSTKSNRRGDA